MIDVVKDWRGIIYVVGARLKNVGAYQPVLYTYYHSFTDCNNKCIELNKAAKYTEYKALKYKFHQRKKQTKGM